MGKNRLDHLPKKHENYVQIIYIKKIIINSYYIVHLSILKLPTTKNMTKIIH